MNAYFNWLNQLVNQNRSGFAEWGELKWLNAYDAARAQERRDEMLGKLQDNLLFKDTKPFHKQVSKGCWLCGQGLWSCLFITGKCNASCFYCPAPQTTDEVPTTQNLSFPDPQSYAEYVNYFGFKGVSFSGGEPLLFFDRTLAYLKEVRKKCSPEIYTWMYTNGILADREKFRALADAGLNEVRFDIGATGFRLDQIACARDFIPNITIEIPAVPEEAEKLKKLLPKMVEAGVSNLNLHQLRLTSHNVKRLYNRAYTYIHAEQPIVLESELAALDIINYARESGIETGINYCSFFFKHRFQKAGFRNRLAMALASPNDELTENGYIRDRGPASVAYHTLRIFDKKPEMLPARTLELRHKTYYYLKEQVMKPTNIDLPTQEWMDRSLGSATSEIPSDQLQFKIWQFENIEHGLREY